MITFLYSFGHFRYPGWCLWLKEKVSCNNWWHQEVCSLKYAGRLSVDHTREVQIRTQFHDRSNTADWLITQQQHSQARNRRILPRIWAFSHINITREECKISVQFTCHFFKKTFLTFTVPYFDLSRSKCTSKSSWTPCFNPTTLFFGLSKPFFGLLCLHKSDPNDPTTLLAYSTLLQLTTEQLKILLGHLWSLLSFNMHRYAQSPSLIPVVRDVSDLMADFHGSFSLTSIITLPKLQEWHDGPWVTSSFHNLLYNHWQETSSVSLVCRNEIPLRIQHPLVSDDVSISVVAESPSYSFHWLSEHSSDDRPNF